MSLELTSASNRPSPPSERELVGLVLPRLTELLPDGWEAFRAAKSGSVDAVVRVSAPDGRSTLVRIEAKTLLNARDVPAIAAELGRPARNDDAIVVARYLSPRAREALTDAGLSFVDATGNLRVSLADPGLVIIASGANSDPYRSPDRPTNSLKGAPAAKVVRALVDRRPPWKMRELAAEAETSLGSTARTVSYLDREALIERDPAGSIVDVDWESLLRRWAEDYDLVKRRRVLQLLAPRGLDSVEQALTESADDNYVISGSLAAQRISPYADARLGLIYARDADELSGLVGARLTPSAPNLIVIEPTDDLVFLRSRLEGGLRFAAPSQVVADLMAGPGRNPEEALALLEWMRRNEDLWRRG